MKLFFHSSFTPSTVLLTLSLCNRTSKDVQVALLEEAGPPVLSIDGDKRIVGDLAICTYLWNTYLSSPFWPAEVYSRALIMEWIQAVMETDDILPVMNTVLLVRPFLAGSVMTVADIFVMGRVQDKLKSLDESLPAVKRWYSFLLIHPYIVPHKKLLGLAYAQKSGPKPAEKRGKSKGLSLDGPKIGKVVTRFPPEPSGYLHIGHAKAALLNYMYAEQRGDKGSGMILRLDDTNPTVEKAEYEENILGDLKKLRIEPKGKIHHTSDHFQQLYDLARELILKGLAYVDDLEKDLMKIQRRQVKPPVRAFTPERRLEIFEGMNGGNKEYEKYCVRLLLDEKQWKKNAVLRDPVIYRINNNSHHRVQGWRVYPTYDFACPIVDSLDGVTHALRTSEYDDRKDLYGIVLGLVNGIDKKRLKEITGRSQLDIPSVETYSRLALTHTLMSKRHLKTCVEEHWVEGWDDPRFPTVQGIVRRGLQVEALKDFVRLTSSTKNIVAMSWDKVWGINAKELEKETSFTLRYFALFNENLMKVRLVGITTVDPIIVPLHPKRNLGNRIINLTEFVLLDSSDVKRIEIGQKVTLMKWGNFERVVGDNVVLKYLPNDKDFKSTEKFTWLPDEDNIKLKIIQFDQLLVKEKLEENDVLSVPDVIRYPSKKEYDAIGSNGIQKVEVGSVLQLERIGYFYFDRMEHGRMVLHQVPTGSERAQVGMKQ